MPKLTDNEKRLKRCDRIYNELGPYRMPAKDILKNIACTLGVIINFAAFMIAISFTVWFVSLALRALLKYLGS